MQLKLVVRQHAQWLRRASIPLQNLHRCNAVVYENQFSPHPVRSPNESDFEYVVTNLQDNIWRSVSVLIAVLPIGVSLTIFQTQIAVSTLEKRVQKHENPVIFPLRDLSSLRQGEKPRLVVTDPAYTTIAAKTFFLENVGLTPIKPSDFVEPLTVRVSSDWSIISVKDRYPMSWHREAPHEYRADPFLINPDDRIAITVYLNSDREFSTPSDADESIDFDVKARIIGLKSFSERPKREKPLSMWEVFPLVQLTPSQVASLLLIASLLLYWQIRAIDRSDLTRSLNARAALMVLSAVLSFAVAEVIVFFWAGGSYMMTLVLRHEFWALRYQWHNWLILVAFAMWSLFLLHRSWTSAAQRRRSPVILP